MNESQKLTPEEIYGLLKSGEKTPDELAEILGIKLNPWSPEKTARLLITSAIDQRDYELAREKIKEMGLNPDDYEQYKPEDI